jgi:uncharacterized protein with PQ loop repeat
MVMSLAFCGLGPTPHTSFQLPRRAAQEDTMTMLPPDCAPAPVNQAQGSAPVGALERILRLMSVVTMLMTIPQVLTIWVGGDIGGISLISWSSYLLSACLWFVYGIQKQDKTIYLACIGWILLDAGVVVGVLVRS